MMKKRCDDQSFLEAYRLLICFILSLLFFASAYGQSYNIAKGYYQKGDFVATESALKQALAGKMAKSEEAKSYKLLGICQFMLGNKSAATTSFRKALSIQPGITILETEVLDEGVIPFFQAQRGAVPVKAPVKKAAAKSPAPSPKAPPAQNNAPNPTEPLAGAKVVKSTFLRVNSNVASASVSIDGIIAGQVNSLINTDPGQIIVEIAANGYITRKLKVSILKNRENNITANLEKPKPKPKPRPKPRPQPRAPTVAAKGGAKPQQQPKRRKAGDDMFAPTPAADAFAADAPAAGPAPSGDPTAEFAMDAATGGAGGYAPPPAYTPPPGYAPPAYAAPAYAPPPVYYAPAPPAYYQPPPPPPPPQDPVAVDPYAGEPPPMDPAGPPSAQAYAPGGSADSGESKFWLYMPLGAGQFKNGRTLLGLTVGGLQALGVFFWYSSEQSANRAITNARAYMAQKKAQNDITDEDRQWARQTEAYAKKQQNNAFIWLMAALGTYAGGVYEAVTYVPPVQKKNRSRRTRGTRGFSLLEPDSDNHLDLTQTRKNSYDPEWNVTLRPLWSQADFEEQIKPGLGLELQFEF